VVGNIITYTPNSNQQGNDSCIIQIKDNENTTTNFTANWTGIDTIAPTTPDNANSTWTSGDVTVTLS
jgi:hypothetical protein